MEGTLSRIQAVLSDAEEREIRDEAVKLWLKELKDLAYLAEDVLAEYGYEFLRIKAEGGDLPRPATRKRKLEARKLVATTTILPTQIAIPGGIQSRIKDIRMRFDELAEEREALSLRNNTGVRISRVPVQPPQSTPYVDESCVYGREEDKKKIIEMLVSEKGSAEKLSVIPIIGMAGIGKTTLARLIYKDPTVRQCFNTRVWVSVSVDFDVIKIYKAIVESITQIKCDLTELSSLQSVLKEELVGKRLLLVLDDVWTEDISLWDSLRVAFISGGRCKFLVTTRNESVARIMQTVLPYQLAGLTEDQAWLLFKQYALENRDPDSSRNLEEIGKKIVRKCKGLPLAVKNLGGLLYYEEDKDKWEDILQSDLWELDEEDDGILPALRVSYHRMPTHLKPCFMYCALFPKNYLFEKDELVKLWMAQGLIPFMETRRAEDIGKKYFDDLHRRSFFQLSPIDEEFDEELPLIRSSLQLSLTGHEQLLQKTSFIISQDEDQKLFLMHDLICDLARSIAGEECNIKKDKKVSYITNEASHLSLIPYETKADIQFEPLKDENRRLRSLLYVNTKVKTLSGGGISDVFQNVRLCSGLFQTLPCLRVIDLSYTRIKELPSSIGQLKLLCYLGLRGSTIKRLPNSLGSLYYLQTLDLKYCTSLQELPNGIVKLINLRHLELPTKDFAACVSLPSGIGTLTRLETLPAFKVNRHCRIDELKQLRNLRGHLGIAGLQNVASGKEATIADLKTKEHLQTLALIWNSEKSTRASSSQGSSEQHSDGSTLNTGSITESSRFLADGILQNLQPYRNLRHLILRGYCGMRFPSWLGDSSFSRLNTISLTKCHSCKLLPPLGQLPCLQKLLIGNMDGIQHVGCEFCGHSSMSSSIAFRALDMLDIECLNQWGEWTGVEDGDFPCLRRLVIKHCSKLNGIPLLPTSLEILEMENVEAITALPKLPSVKSLDLQGKWNENLWASTLELQSLHSLEISWSEDLCILHLHGSLDALNNLEISDCMNLTLIVELHKITSLEHLRLHALPKFQFSPDDRLPPTLLSLDISSCPNLTSLPLYQPLSALRELSITNCEQISTLMCLQNLNSLESLTLDACPELFLNSDDVLPVTLQYLEISSCNKLSALPRLHENLSALKELHIEDCEQLTTVVGLCNLTSLELMVISFCPKFHFLPDEQLPTSTLDIEIEDCPRLTEWCQRHGIKQKVALLTNVPCMNIVPFSSDKINSF
ncbi:hypothetical protein B296_00026168 [Ensete ventricosum]|uniref:NB-ARC domain-containing protein n=1 Tax=Ensete ventricosum TaxID=4639 RepID=A0A427ABF4_ENSVE|nr:hypothetical protein B296_00026168 [Ensete ventricosum]